MHDDVILNRSAIPEALQKGRCVRRAAHGIRDEIGRQLLPRAAVALDRSRPGDAFAIRRRYQLGDILAALDRHIPDRLEAPPNMALEERSARHIHRESLRIDG